MKNDAGRIKKDDDGSFYLLTVSYDGILSKTNFIVNKRNINYKSIFLTNGIGIENKYLSFYVIFKT